MTRPQSSRADLLQAAFRRLPGELRDVLLLVRAEKLTYAEAARRLGISAGEVKLLLARALERLDRELERQQWQGWRLW